MNGTARTLLVAIAVCSAAGGCGMDLFDETAGGADNLPTRGAGPFAKPALDFDTAADEPFVVVQPGTHLTDPSALRDPSGGLRIWFGRQVVDDEQVSIHYVLLPSIYQLPVAPPALVLDATEEWEQGVVTEPSVVDLGDGHLVLYYRGGVDAPAIGRADSTDNGATFTKHAANPLLPLATDPAAAWTDEGVLLYYTASGSESGRGIRLATSADGVSFEATPEPVVTPRPAAMDNFDRDAVAEPFAVATALSREGGTSELHVGLYFAGARPAPKPEDPPLWSIGYAGSFDGATFERFMDGTAILDPDAPGEGAPTVVVESTSAVMLFHQAHQGVYRIAAAVHP